MFEFWSPDQSNGSICNQNWLGKKEEMTHNSMFVLYDVEYFQCLRNLSPLPSLSMQNFILAINEVKIES